MAQEAAVPAGFWARVQKMIDDSIARYARSGPLRNASITGGAGLTVGAGGKLVVQHPDGRDLMLMGEYDSSNVYNMPDGSRQPMALIWRSDGSLALGMFDPTPANGLQQFLALYDRGGNIIVSDDTNSGQGLARPYVPGVFYPARYGDWLSTTSSTFETVWRCRMPKQQPQLYVRAWATNDTSGATGQVQVMVNSVQLGSTVSTSFAQTEYVFGPLPVTGKHMDTLVVELNARVATGTGGVRVGAARLEGQQS